MIPPFVDPSTMPPSTQVFPTIARPSAYDPTHGYKTPTPPVGGPPQVMPPQAGAMPQQPQMAPPQGGQGQGHMPGQPQGMPQQQHGHMGGHRPMPGNQQQPAMEQMQSQIALQHLKGGRGVKPQALAATPMPGVPGPLVR